MDHLIEALVQRQTQAQVQVQVHIKSKFTRRSHIYIIMAIKLVALLTIGLAIFAACEGELVGDLGDEKESLMNYVRFSNIHQCHTFSSKS